MFRMEDIKDAAKEIEEIEKRKAMPWDLLWPSTEYVPEEIYDERYNTCLNCEFITKLSPKVCKKCKCWMRLKSAYSHSECPEGKWGAHTGESFKRELPKTQEEADLIDRTSVLSMEAINIFKKQQALDEVLDDSSKS